MLFEVISCRCELKCYTFILLVMHWHDLGFHRLLQKQRLNVLHFANQEMQVSVCFLICWLFCIYGYMRWKRDIHFFLFFVFVAFETSLLCFPLHF
jgi:hypothetical protein